MKVESFAEMEEEFRRRISRIAWCNVATADARGRLRSRVLHPLWEGSTGWILTGRQSPKTRDLAANPNVSLSYYDQAHEQVYAECRTEWEERPAEKQRIWDLFRTTPAPMGYDPGLFWKSPDDPTYGVLHLAPWRIELASLADLMSGKTSAVWMPR
jgi:general stress protein 26